MRLRLIIRFISTRKNLVDAKRWTFEFLQRENGVLLLLLWRLEFLQRENARNGVQTSSRIKDLGLCRHDFGASDQGFQA